MTNFNNNTVSSTISEDRPVIRKLKYITRSIPVAASVEMTRKAVRRVKNVDVTKLGKAAVAIGGLVALRKVGRSIDVNLFNKYGMDINSPEDRKKLTKMLNSDVIRSGFKSPTTKDGLTVNGQALVIAAAGAFLCRYASRQIVEAFDPNNKK